MKLDDAARIVGRLKAAYPLMTLDEAEAETLIREVALLRDAAIMDEAVSHLIRREQRFPTIALLRLAYRSVAEGYQATRAALQRAAEPAGDRAIPEWVHVWWWQLNRTRLERQMLNTTSRQPVAERSPLKMRDFPQYETPGPDAYSVDEYEQIRSGWAAAGSPNLKSAAEVFAAMGAKS